MMYMAQIILLAFFVAGLVPALSHLTVRGADYDAPSEYRPIDVVVAARL